MSAQLGFFHVEPEVPPGFLYRARLITADDETALVDQIRALPFREFEFHGYTGKRRVVSFGRRYDFATEALREAEEIPPFLATLRESAAGFAGLAASELQQALVTEYGAGAAIGWHRDKSVFGEVVGVSLLSPCTFRLRRKSDGGWQRYSLTAERRSAYLLSGLARTEWEHSIPAVGALRYSVTFRNLRRP